MDENLHNIDDLFKDAIEPHTTPPSAAVWESINYKLDVKHTEQLKKKYNHLKKLVALLLLLLSSVVVYELYKTQNTAATIVKTTENNKTDKNKQITTQTATSETEKVNNNFTAADISKFLDKQNTRVTTTNTISTSKDVATNTDNATLNRTITKQEKKNTKTTIDVEDNDEYFAKKAKAIKQKRLVNVKITTAKLYSDEDDLTNNEDTDPINLSVNKFTKIDKQTADKESTILGLQKSNLNDIAIANNSKPKKAVGNKLHFSITPIIGSQYSFARIEEGEHEPNRPRRGNDRDEIQKDEKHQSTLAFGLLVNIDLGKRLGIQTGVNIFRKRTEIEPKKIFADVDNDGKIKYKYNCSSGYTYLTSKVSTTPAVGDSIYTSNSSNTLSYLNIPIAVTYSIPIKRFSIIPTAGVGLNFLLHQKIQTNLVSGSNKEGTVTSTVQGLQKMYLNGTAGIALEYKLNKRFSLHAMPSASFALTPINKNTPVKSFYNSFNVQAGVKISF